MGQSPDDIARAEPLKAAQLENVKLDNQKLRLEIAEIEKSQRGINKIGKFTSVFTTLIAVAGLVIGQFQNLQQQKERARALDIEREKERALREQESKKPFWQKQVDLYFDASNAVSTLINSTDAVKRQQAEDRFWQLFYGELVIVEDQNVERAMIDISSYLIQCRQSPPRCEDYKLKNLALALSSSCRQSIGESWKLGLEGLKGKYNQPANNQSAPGR
jgi:hypothetical protein